MKIEDVNQFKGVVKNALQDWGNAKIDEMLAKKAAPKAFLKNGLNNMLTRFDANINKWVDNIFLFVANEDGVIDSDSMIDTLAGIFKEMPKKEYSFGSFSAIAGGGEVIISFPHNFLMDMLVGDMGSVKFTTEDILDFKELFV